MMTLLEHRGPDGDGFWSSQSGAVFGHRRLAIIDLLGGYQPQFNETREIAVIMLEMWHRSIYDGKSDSVPELQTLEVAP